MGRNSVGRSVARFKLETKDVVAIYGFDHTKIGFFIEIRSGGKLLQSRDGLQTGGYDLQDILRVLVEHGFFATTTWQRRWTRSRSSMSRTSTTPTCDVPPWSSRN